MVVDGWWSRRFGEVGVSHKEGKRELGGRWRWPFNTGRGEVCDRESAGTRHPRRWPSTERSCPLLPLAQREPARNSVLRRDAVGQERWGAPNPSSSGVTSGVLASANHGLE
jgi:hypothetical protein